MNHASDLNTFVGWAEATCNGRWDRPDQRPFNAAVIFKRAAGQGRIREIRGLERLVARYRPHIVDIDLLPPGTPRRNWKQTLLSDGFIVVRHPDLDTCLHVADAFGTDVQMIAG